MIITKASLPRRTLLRGAGVTLALPFLDAMVPALTATSRSVAAFAPRMAFFGCANGVHMPDFRPTAGPRGMQLSTILKALEPYKDRLVVVEGLSNSSADTKDVGGGPHARGAGAFLSGVRPKRTEGADIELAKTLDQFAADRLGDDTQLRSLELAIESSFVGNCDQGYSCAYVNTLSWRGARTPNPMENNPRLVFERLFGDGGSIDARIVQLREDRSILDFVRTDMARMQKQLGPGDLLTVNEYLDAVRDVEKRIQNAEEHGRLAPLPSAPQPLGIPDSYQAHFTLMLDLLFLAYQADITRVATFQVAREQTNLTYPQIGVPEGHHNTSHHQGDPVKIGQNTKINAYHVELFSRLVEKMRSTPDGDGSLLDHAIVFYGATLGDGDLHSVHNLPVILVGGGSGRLKGNRHLKYPVDTPLMNLGLSLLEKVGVELERIGDSTGRLADV
jgi:hypothetical protein